MQVGDIKGQNKGNSVHYSIDLSDKEEITVNIVIEYKMKKSDSIRYVSMKPNNPKEKGKKLP